MISFMMKLNKIINIVQYGLRIFLRTLFVSFSFKSKHHEHIEIMKLQEL